MTDIPHNLKDIQCYKCESKHVTAYVYLNIDNEPMISLDCAKCKSPITGIKIDPLSLKFVLDVENKVEGAN